MVQDVVSMESEMEVATRKNFLGQDAYESAENEDYMCDRQRIYFSQLLHSWYYSLVSDSDNFKLSLQAGEVYVDDMDRAAQEESQRMSLRSSDRKRKLIVKVQQAMKRVEQGTFGFCKSCEGVIGISRLEARPTAEECINCKTVSEIYEKRGRE